MEQRTPEWFLARKGKITASEAYVLLANHKESMTEEELAAFKAANPKSRTTTKEVPFSDSTFTYLKKKVAELFMSDEAFLDDQDAKQLNSRAVQHGSMYEGFARNKFQEVTGINVEEAGFIPMKGYETICGGSPDGLIVDGIIEIKCPWNTEVHQDYMLFESAEDLKDYNLQYYVQMQLNMMVTDTHHGYFISYDPRMEGAQQMKVLRVDKDEAICEQLAQRVALAEKYMHNRIDRLNSINN